MTAQEYLAGLAQPGDGDLDLDVDGLTLSALVVSDRHVLVGFRGGYGTWVDVDGARATFAPGDPAAGVTEGQLDLFLPDASDSLFTMFVDRLQGWLDRSVPLRMCAAPGRMSTLIEDRSTFLPLPRRELPDPDGH